MGEVQKFDPNTLMQGVKDRIKSEFVSLIPDDQWAQMIQKEVDDFFKNTRDYSGYNQPKISPFQTIVQQTLQEVTKNRMAAYLLSPEFEVVWDQHGQPKATEAVKKLFIDSGGVMLAEMFGGMFSSMLSNFSSQLRNKQY